MGRLVVGDDLLVGCDVRLVLVEPLTDGSALLAAGLAVGLLLGLAAPGGVHAAPTIATSARTAARPRIGDRIAGLLQARTVGSSRRPPGIAGGRLGQVSTVGCGCQRATVGRLREHTLIESAVFRSSG